MQQTVNASPKFETFSVSMSFGACRYERCFLDAKGLQCGCCCLLYESLRNDLPTLTN